MTACATHSIAEALLRVTTNRVSELIKHPPQGVIPLDLVFTEALDAVSSEEGVFSSVESEGFPLLDFYASVNERIHAIWKRKGYSEHSLPKEFFFSPEDFSLLQNTAMELEGQRKRGHMLLFPKAIGKVLVNPPKGVIPFQSIFNKCMDQITDELNQRVDISSTSRDMLGFSDSMLFDKVYHHLYTFWNKREYSMESLPSKIVFSHVELQKLQTIARREHELKMEEARAQFFSFSFDDMREFFLNDLPPVDESGKKGLVQLVNNILLSVYENPPQGIFYLKSIFDQCLEELSNENPSIVQWDFGGDEAFLLCLKVNAKLREVWVKMEYDLGALSDCFFLSDFQKMQRIAQQEDAKLMKRKVGETLESLQLDALKKQCIDLFSKSRSVEPALVLSHLYLCNAKLKSLSRIFLKILSKPCYFLNHLTEPDVYNLIQRDVKLSRLIAEHLKMRFSDLNKYESSMHIPVNEELTSVLQGMMLQSLQTDYDLICTVESAMREHYLDKLYPQLIRYFNK